jgi:hypothetical protein
MPPWLNTSASLEEIELPPNPHFPQPIDLFQDKKSFSRVMEKGFFG